MHGQKKYFKKFLTESFAVSQLLFTMKYQCLTNLHPGLLDTYSHLMVSSFSIYVFGILIQIANAA